ncbi:hypothetical protein MTO96_006377 [Rhipicephalus appendiculatus]
MANATHASRSESPPFPEESLGTRSPGRTSSLGPTSPGAISPLSPRTPGKDITQSKVPRSDVFTRAKVTRSGVITRAKVTGRDDITRAKVTRSDVFTRIVANCEVTSWKDCPQGAHRNSSNPWCGRICPIHRRRELEDEPSFEESKSDVLFACFVPIVLTILGIGLVFILSRRGGKAEEAAHGKAFLICRMRSKDLWEEVVKPATRFCTHLILTPWGNDFDERDRSEQEFFRAAFNRTRLYLTVPPEDCTRTNINELMTRLRSLRLDGFEFYMKGNESANDVRLCSNLIDRFVSLKDPSAAILRSGPYGTLVKPNVLANVYHVHAPIDDDGRIHDAIFINNYDYTDTGHGGVDMVRIADVLMRAQKERAESVAAGAPHITNICYSLSFMGMRMDTRTMVKYSQVCETVQCCLVDKSPLRNDHSRSLVATVMNRSLYNVSYDDANTLAEKAKAVSLLTRGALCISADDVQADDFGGKCGGASHKAPLLTVVAELARLQNGAFLNYAGGSDKHVFTRWGDPIPPPKFELPPDILL